VIAFRQTEGSVVSPGFQPFIAETFVDAWFLTNKFFMLFAL
jgi:hypothetical protein